MKNITLIFALMFLIVCKSFSQVSDKELFEHVERQTGRVLAPEEAPQTYRNLNIIFDILAKSQEQLSEGSAVSINHVHLVQSHEPNAFIIPIKQIGVRIFRSHAFITTGLLDQIFKAYKSNPTEALLAMGGVLAHELGHPLDSIELFKGEISIENHYKSGGNQAIEIRADIDAVRIMRAAKFPVDSLYKALKVLKQLSENQSQNSLQAIAGTHPEIDFRLTSARLFLTFDRLTQSSLQAPFMASEAEAIHVNREIEILSQQKEKFPYKIPQSFSEVVKRLSALNDATDVLPENINLEFNRLVLSGDKFLEQMEKEGRSLSTEEEAAFKQFLDLIHDKQSYTFRADHLKRYINDNTTASGLERTASHEYYLNNLKIYSSDLVRTYLQDKSSDYPNIDEFGVTREVMKFSDCAHPRLFYTVFRDQLLQIIHTSQGNAEVHDAIMGRGLTFFSLTTELIDNSRMTTGLTEASNDYHNELLKIESSDTNILYPLFVKEVKAEKQRDVAKLFLTSYRQALLFAHNSKDERKKKEMQAAIEAVKKHFQHIWDRRAYYAVIETQLNSRVLNWDLLFEILEIDQKIGLQKIETAVRDYRNGKITHLALGLPSFQDIERALSDSKVRGMYKGFRNWLAWDFKGVLSTFLPDNGEKSVVVEKYRVKNKDRFARDYQRDLSIKIDSLTNLDLFIENHLSVVPRAELLREVLSYDSSFFYKIYLQLILKGKMNSNLKKELLRFILFRQKPVNTNLRDSQIEGFFKVFTSDNALSYANDFSTAKLAIEAYRKTIGGDAIDYFIELRASIKRLSVPSSEYYGAINQSFSAVLEGLEKRQFRTFQDLDKTLEFLDPVDNVKVAKYSNGNHSETYSSDTNSETSQRNSARIQKIKNAILKKAQSLSLSDSEKYKLFLRLVRTGPTRETDAFILSLMKVDSEVLKSENLEKLSFRYSSKQIARFQNLLEAGYVKSEKLRLHLAQLALERDLARLEKALPVDRESLYQLIVIRLKKYAPQGSIEKDAFIERIAWRLKLRGSELDGFIEDQKSQNWRKENPAIIRFGSLISSHLGKMSRTSRYNFIQYLMDPEVHETTLFDDIVKEMIESIYQELLYANRKVQLDETAIAKLRRKAEMQAEHLRLQVEESIRDSSPTERIPLFDVILNAGSSALIKDKNWVTDIGERYLGFKPNSVENAGLLSLLEILPEHEATVAISYLLANSSQGEGNAARLYELFDTVGIKYGQFASIYELNGPKAAEDAKHLKNAAKPVSLFETIRLAQKRNPDVKELVTDYVRILGNASVKSVVQVKLRDGQQAAMMLRREGIVASIAMNIDLGKKFIEALRRKDVIQDSQFMQAMIAALEEQLHDEISFTSEAEKVKIAQKYLDILNSDMKAELQGWTLRAPQLIESMPLQEDLAFYRVIDGVSFDELTADEKKTLGALVVKSNLRMMFAYGWMEPDRHTGNFLFDRKSKEIIFLDYGQFANFNKTKNPFKWDPTLTLAYFVNALSKMDTAGIVHYAKLMSSTQISAETEKRIISQLDLYSKSMDGYNFRDSMLRAVNILMNNGLRLESKYVFGALKGIMVLYGENYVSQEDFVEIFKSVVKSSLIRKAPVVLAEGIRSAIRKKPKGQSLRCETVFK